MTTTGQLDTRDGRSAWMTAEQPAKSGRLGQEGGTANVEFRQGMIEEPPLEAGSVDCVISKGVVNLAPDKATVFGAAASTLRSGGRTAIADLTSVSLPAVRTREGSR